MAQDLHAERDLKGGKGGRFGDTIRGGLIDARRQEKESHGGQRWLGAIF